MDGLIEFPQARRIERPTWINVRTVLGLALFVGSLVAGQQLVSTPAPSTRLWVAAHEIAPGSSVLPQDLRAIDADLPPEAIERYALASTSLAGAYVARGIPEGQLIPLDSLAASAPSASRQMTVPVQAEHAVGGDLRAGDVIDILVTLDAGRPSARTTVLVSEAEVLGVVQAAGSFGSESAPIGVTIAVAAEDAPRLALALRTGEIDIVRAVATGDTAQGEVTTGDL